MSSNAIHPTAVVDPAAELDTDVTIGPHAIIEAGVRVGRGTRIGPRVHCCSGATLGMNCEIHTGAVIADTPQVVKGAPQSSSVIIGDHCIIREYATIHRSMKEGGATVIGNHCFLMVNSHVAHDCVLGNNVILVNGALLAGHVQLDDNVIISGNAVIHQFCRAGKLSFLSGVSGLVKDLPPYMIATGPRAHVVGLNIVGLRRAGISAEARQQLKRAFHILYRRGWSTSQSLSELEKLEPTTEIQNLITFIRATKRGIASASAKERLETEEAS